MRKNNKLIAGIVALAGTTLVGASGAYAAEILVNADITTSTTWTKNNTYNLQKQIFVRNGATLTIEPGTIVASTTNIGGSLAVVRGSKINAVGTQLEPIIFTSKADVATWTNGNPKTGVWRVAANEWGNITLMGNAYISNSLLAGNTATFNANNTSPMEGLVAAFPGDPDVRYGGGNDDDDSGSLKYVSLRYGGKVIGLNNELNGLSLGGIGRETDIAYIDIMNNVDDGIEIWGGTVDLKYVNIWNIGDDSFDVDQGWRGRLQFGLIVQGYSANAAQGSGVGDNVFETDGAENSDAQPVTTATVYNVTMIGQPISGDQATAWRAGARVQYRNCLIMDIGEQVVRNDDIDGDGSQGYGFNGTLTFPQIWTTGSDQFSTVNAPANPALFYQAQLPGKLAELKDSVFFRNLAANAYNAANNNGVFDPANNNVLIPGFAVADEPVVQIIRGPLVNPTPTLTMLPVIGLDPRAKGPAATSVESAPSNGFFTPAQYRGGFSATENWTCDWTASDAFGFNIAPAGTCTVEGPDCPSDLNSDGKTDAADLTILLGAWGPKNTGGDLNGDGKTDAADLTILLGSWGPC